MPKTTSSVVFAFLTIMLCQHGSTMKCTVQGCGERWETFLRGHVIMAQGKLRKKISFEIIASSPSYLVNKFKQKCSFQGQGALQENGFLDSRYKETKYFKQQRPKFVLLLLLTNLFLSKWQQQQNYFW